MYQIFRSILPIWLLGIGACNHQPAVSTNEGHKVPLAMELRDSIETLKQYKQDLKSHLNQKMNSYELRSVRDIELYEFVGDHDVFKKNPLYASGTFSDSSKVYKGPAFGDSIVEVFPFKTRFNALERVGDRVRVELYSTGEEVYLNSKDLYQFHTTLYDLQTDITISPVQKDENGTYKLLIAFSKYRRNQKQRVQEIPVAYENCQVMGIGNSLNHGRYVFAIVQTSGEVELVDFYQYQEGAFQKIVGKQSQRLSNGYDCTRVYLPLEYRDGLTRQVLALPFQGFFNMATGQTNMLEIPDSVDINPRELIVLQHEQSQMLVGNPGYEALEDNDEMVYIEQLITEYYQWNGSNLRLIATHVSKYQGS